MKTKGPTRRNSLNHNESSKMPRTHMLDVPFPLITLPSFYSYVGLYTSASWNFLMFFHVTELTLNATAKIDWFMHRFAYRDPREVSSPPDWQPFPEPTFEDGENKTLAPTPPPTPMPTPLSDTFDVTFVVF
jgi:hypothetical protein